MDVDALLKQVTQDRLFVESLALKRSKIGVSDEHMARLVGVTVEELISIEHGFSDPSLKILRKYANVVGVSLEHSIVDHKIELSQKEL